MGSTRMGRNAEVSCASAVEMRHVQIDIATTPACSRACQRVCVVLAVHCVQRASGPFCRMCCLVPDVWVCWESVLATQE